MNWLDEVRWDERGLIPVIAQEAATGDVLMFAWMNREALQKQQNPGGRCISAARGRGFGAKEKSPVMCKPCMTSGWTAITM